ncbi:hypothetical protein DFJ74DRAFT_472748 [Hyaloraphidium curvatum]|nr:hypothetical protein DFJ74DRAFT_472748 [Hyaloraphidium curvatum]
MIEKQGCNKPFRAPDNSTFRCGFANDFDVWWDANHKRFCSKCAPEFGQFRSAGLLGHFGSNQWVWGCGKVCYERNCDGIFVEVTCGNFLEGKLVLHQSCHFEHYMREQNAKQEQERRLNAMKQMEAQKLIARKRIEAQEDADGLRNYTLFAQAVKSGIGPSPITARRANSRPDTHMVLQPATGPSFVVENRAYSEVKSFLLRHGYENTTTNPDVWVRYMLVAAWRALRLAGF